MVAAMRNAVVTGAGSGMGREIAFELGRRGYRVWATDIDLEAAASTAAQIGGEAESALLDVRDGAACRELAERVAADGALAVWVNNAGVFFSGVPWEQGAELRELMFDVNTKGLINGTLAALAPMIAAGHGHVVNVVSLAGIIAAPGEVDYSASKHAALAYTLGTQFDLRRRGIKGVRVSAVCPDGVWTPMLEDKLDDPDSAGSFSGQLQTPEKVAREVGKLAQRPRPILIIPRWRGPQLRLLDYFPGLCLRIVPLIMWDARRRQRSYKKRIEAGTWPRSG
jgi:NAD(P)-dependent dehydrogenase (short-subunit alcohol dehydrogenase family)